jgi:thioredoxin 1
MKLLKFYATWCAPCKGLTMTLNSISDQITDAVTVVNIDIDADMDSARKYNVRGVPTMVIEDDDGKEVRRATGTMDAPALLKFIKGE